MADLPTFLDEETFIVDGSAYVVQPTTLAAIKKLVEHELATLEGKVARMQPVVDIAVKLRGRRAALDHAARQGKSQDFMGQLRERYGMTGRELDRAVDQYGVIDELMTEYNNL